MNGLRRIRADDGRQLERGVSGPAGAVIVAVSRDGRLPGLTVHSAVPLDKKDCVPHEHCEYLPGRCWVTAADPAYAIAMICVAGGSESDLYTAMEGFYSSLADLQ